MLHSPSFSLECLRPACGKPQACVQLFVSFGVFVCARVCEKQLKCERQPHLGKNRYGEQHRSTCLGRTASQLVCTLASVAHIQYETMQSCQMKGEERADADTKQISERMHSVLLRTHASY